MRAKDNCQSLPHMGCPFRQPVRRTDRIVGNTVQELLINDTSLNSAGQCAQSPRAPRSALAGLQSRASRAGRVRTPGTVSVFRKDGRHVRAPVSISQGDTHRALPSVQGRGYDGLQVGHPFREGVLEPGIRPILSKRQTDMTPWDTCLECKYLKVN